MVKMPNIGCVCVVVYATTSPVATSVADQKFLSRRSQNKHYLLTNMFRVFIFSMKIILKDKLLIFT